METALNLGWLLVTTLLLAGCMVARQRRCLRVPFVTAVACSVLLAAILFPSISMTDDLQRIDLEAEVGLKSALVLLHAFVAEPVSLVFALLLFTLLALCARMQSQRAIVASRQDHLPSRAPAYRPAAVRPPTLLPACLSRPTA